MIYFSCIRILTNKIFTGKEKNLNKSRLFGIEHLLFSPLCLDGVGCMQTCPSFLNATDRSKSKPKTYIPVVYLLLSDTLYTYRNIVDIIKAIPQFAA